MAKPWQNLANLLEYFGIRSRSYYHSVPEVIHDLSDPLAYYLDFRPRADYRGPFTSSGLPLTPGPNGPFVFPTHVAMYALGHLETYRRTQSDGNLARFCICADWLVESQQADGAWPVNAPKKEFGLAAPFRSAMVQGLAISVLVRAAHALNNPGYAASAERGLLPFDRKVGDGGVTTFHDAGPFYEEYPCQPPCHVLNGCIYALLGMHDLNREGSSDASRRFDSGIRTLAAWLPRYDMGTWSRYHLPEAPTNPATVAYHRLHINQLATLYGLTSVPVFLEYRDRWQAYLNKRSNALRTLPAKLSWVMGRRRHGPPLST